jgi:serine protease Do
MKYLALVLTLAACGAQQPRVNTPEDGLPSLLRDTVALVDDHGPYCSGVVWGSYVLTAAHCVDPGGEGTVGVLQFKHVSPVAYTLVKRDPDQDLALLVPVEPTRLPRGILISPEDPIHGEAVVVVGHAWGLFEWSVSNGVVAFPKRVGNSLMDDQVWVQITAPVYPGNSGGPVTNQFGELIGIVSFRTDATLAGAVHTESIRAFLSEFIE